MLIEFNDSEFLSCAQMEGFNSPLTSKITSCLGGAPTIIFGIDVSHGSIGENFPSVAAVVATKNWPDVFHFATRTGTQQSKLKLIEGLWEPKSAMVKLVIYMVKFFYRPGC